MQFSIKFSINFKRSAHPASRQTDSTDSTFQKSGVSRLYDELCSQLCEIIETSNAKICALCIMNYALIKPLRISRLLSK